MGIFGKFSELNVIHQYFNQPNQVDLVFGKIYVATYVRVNMAYDRSRFSDRVAVIVNFYWIRS